MIDPISLAGLSKAATALYDVADRIVSSRGTDTGRVIEFCDQVRAMLDDAAKLMEAHDTLGLSRRAAELQQWHAVGMSVFDEAVPSGTKDGLSAAITRVAILLDDPHLTKAPDDVRHSAALELARSAGTLGGLADVLRFKAGNAPAPSRGWGRLGTWMSETGSVMAASATAAVLAAGVSKVPVVGETLASLMQGEVPGKSDEDA